MEKPTKSTNNSTEAHSRYLCLGKAKTVHQKQSVKKIVKDDDSRLASRATLDLLVLAARPGHGSAVEESNILKW